MIMTLLRIILVLLVCIPVGYLLLYLSNNLMDNVRSSKKKDESNNIDKQEENRGYYRDYNNEKRPIHNNRRPGRGR